MIFNTTTFDIYSISNKSDFNKILELLEKISKKLDDNEKKLDKLLDNNNDEFENINNNDI
jgi:exonuclease VII small subunit